MSELVDDSSENLEEPIECVDDPIEKNEDDIDKVSLGDPKEFEEFTANLPMEDDQDKEQNGNKELEEHGSKENGDELTYNVELEGLPKYYSFGQLKKLVNETLQLKAMRFKAYGKGKNYVLMTFDTEAARGRSITILTGYEWKGSVFIARIPDPNKDPLALTKIESINISPSLQKLPLEEKIVRALTPYAEFSYEEQLKKKENLVLSLMKKYGNELSQLNPELYNWVTWHKLRRKGQICEVDPIVPSPVTEGYRNAAKFIIGYDSSVTKVPAIGFRMSDFNDGTLYIAPVHMLKDINKATKQVVKKMLKSNVLLLYNIIAITKAWLNAKNKDK